MNKKIKQPHVSLNFARGDGSYPTVLLECLGEKVPDTLTAIGPIELLASRKTAIFCSARTPGDAILRAHGG
ncbi:MAG: hypothetical protein WA974_17450 [Thermodesulfobacteriota bacterium]